MTCAAHFETELLLASPEYLEYIKLMSIHDTYEDVQVEVTLELLDYGTTCLVDLLTQHIPPKETSHV